MEAKRKLLRILGILAIACVITACKFIISSVTGPDNTETERLITLTVSGNTTGESEGSIEYGIILQIPESWEVLGGRTTGGTLLSENPAHEVFYTADPGYKIWVGTVVSGMGGGGHHVDYSVKLQVGDFSGAVGEVRDYTLKAMSGAFRQGAWETDDPQGIYNFSMVSEEQYLKTITVTKVIHDEPVFIPDTDLEAAIREALGIDPSTVITQEMAESLVSLDAYPGLIASLSGLEYFANLTDLKITWSIISDWTPLNGLTSLTNLNLCCNQISDLSPLSTLTNLTDLDLNYNQISNLTPLNGLTSLTDLVLSSNQIVDLSPLSALTSLTDLDLSGNQISDLSPLSTLINLTDLDLDYNQISNLTPLNGLTSLTDLDLSGNQIVDLSPLSTLINLTNLSLSSNQISDLGPLVANTGLGPCVGIFCNDTIDLRHNPLSSPDACTDVGILRSRGAIVYVDLFPCGSCLAQVQTDHTWNIRQLPFTFQDPVVIVGPPTYHGADPGVVRLQNVTNNSFDIRFQEWLYKDGAHTQENIPYLVISGGRHDMTDGSIWQAGTFSLSGTGNWISYDFGVMGTGTFPSTPAIFLTAQTYNGSDPITVRARNVTNTGFDAALFEEEAKMDGHTTEEVGYLAVYSPQLSGTVNINGTDVPYLLQAQSVDHRFVPVLSSDIKLEEEKSNDSEVNHCDETFSILALGDKIFTQDISSNGGDTASIRRLAPEYGAAMEWGTVDGVDHNWMKIPFAKEYLNPVVVAKPVSSRGGDPGVIRIRNVSHNSFELRYNEWLYKDGWHTQERVFYMVVEAGERSVAGLWVEAKKLNSSKLLADGWESINFSASFSQTPSIFTSVQTYNGADPVTTRLSNCTVAGFDLTMDEEEAKNDGHITETIGWIAIEKGTGSTADNRSVVVLSSSTSHNPTQINFGQSMARRFPVVISDMITTHGGDPGFLRYQNLGPNSIDLFIQEETSLDTEMNHTTEGVSVFVGE